MKDFDKNEPWSAAVWWTLLVVHIVMTLFVYPETAKATPVEAGQFAVLVRATFDALPRTFLIMAILFFAWRTPDGRRAIETLPITAKGFSKGAGEVMVSAIMLAVLITFVISIFSLGQCSSYNGDVEYRAR